MAEACGVARPKPRARASSKRRSMIFRAIPFRHASGTTPTMWRPAVSLMRRCLTPAAAQLLQNEWRSACHPCRTSHRLPRKSAWGVCGLLISRCLRHRKTFSSIEKVVWPPRWSSSQSGQSLETASWARGVRIADKLST